MENNKIGIIIIILFLCVVIIGRAETPLECAQKHPNASFVIFSKALIQGNNLDFDIERIAIYSFDLKVFIKKSNNEEDVVRYIEDSISIGDNGWLLKLVGGGGVCVLPSKKLFIYVPSSESANMAAYEIDIQKGLEFSSCKQK